MSANAVAADSLKSVIGHLRGFARTIFSKITNNC